MRFSDPSQFGVDLRLHRHGKALGGSLSRHGLAPFGRLTRRVIPIAQNCTRTHQNVQRRTNRGGCKGSPLSGFNALCQTCRLWERSRWPCNGAPIRVSANSGAGRLCSGHGSRHMPKDFAQGGKARLLLDYEGAYALSMSVGALQDLVYKGRGPVATRIGRCTFFAVKDLEAFIDAHREAL